MREIKSIITGIVLSIPVQKEAAMYLRDRWVEAFWEKFGSFGLIGLIGGGAIVLIIGVVAAAALNSKYNKPSP